LRDIALKLLQAPQNLRKEYFREGSEMPYILLWLLGVPLPILIILLLLWH
jgi:hypothetical protein